MVARIDDLLDAACKALPPKPADTEPRPKKQAYSQKVSEAMALAFADELRQRGLTDTRPSPPGVSGASGAERRMSGGIGAKQVDVSWSTEESGLLLGVSIKTINFRDRRSGNYQKNLTNRRGEMLFESVTLHRRFPYSVLAGVLFLDEGAADDQTERRDSTFNNAHKRFALFTDRDDPGGREEQYERFVIALLDANPFQPSIIPYRVGDPKIPTTWGEVFDDLVAVIAERNPDFYEDDGGSLKKIP